jgi:uncharacterized protein (TIGR03382 family)
MVISITLAAPRRSSAEVLTIDDGGRPGTTDIPFTCSVDGERRLWLPSMGFVYRNVEAFELTPGDTIAFDIQMRTTDPADLGFLPQLDIALAHAPDPQNPFKPADLPGSDFTIVAHAATAASPGNRNVEDYELAFTVDTPFHFPGGGLIIRVTNPQGVLATRTDLQCQPVITADLQPTGTNRLVGTFALEAGEYPWNIENTTNLPGVPYVRITWTRCGDGVLQKTEECDSSANPDPFCDNTCHLSAVAKGSGCSTGDGAGLAMVLVIVALALVLVRRRRAAGLAVLIGVSWAGWAQAQGKTDGFRVDRFEMAPSVDDGLVVQDPGVLRHMAWSVNVALGFTDTLLRVVPKLSSDNGVDVVGPRLSADLDFALGLGDRFELDVAVPFALAQSTEAGTAAGIMLRRAGTTALGDARVGGSALLYGRSTGPRVGLAANVAIPVGSETSFTGDPGAGAEVLATGGFVEPGYRVIVNGGVRLRHEADYVTSDQGTELIGRAGVFVPVASDRLVTSLELDLTARASGHDAYKALGSPVLALLGARYHFPSGLRAGAGIGVGLTEAPGSPAVRALITVGYSPEPSRQKPVPAPVPVPALVDSDGDRIPDTLDKCPSQPEDYNGFQDEDGCPDGPPDPGKPLTLEDVITLPAPIEFKFDTAIMLPGAEIYLNQVLGILQTHSEVLKLEIQGHTSAEGGAEYNLRLSNDRAKAVLKWLVDHGIDGQRLVPHGFGLTQPLVPNNSEPNRQRNRRVQFRLIEQAPGSAPVRSLPGARPPPATTPPR